MMGIVYGICGAFFLLALASWLLLRDPPAKPRPPAADDDAYGDVGGWRG